MNVTVGTTCANAMPTVSTFQAATAASAPQASSCLPAGPVWVSPACLTGLTPPGRWTDRCIVLVMWGKCQTWASLVDLLTFTGKSKVCLGMLIDSSLWVNTALVYAWLDLDLFCQKKLQMCPNIYKTKTNHISSVWYAETNEIKQTYHK